MDGYITCFFVARCQAVHTDLWTVVDPAVPPVSHQPIRLQEAGMCHKHQEVHSQSMFVVQLAPDLCLACIPVRNSFKGVSEYLRPHKKQTVGKCKCLVFCMFSTAEYTEFLIDMLVCK